MTGSLLTLLLDGDSVSTPHWQDLWGRLEANEVGEAEIGAILGAVSVATPRAGTLRSFVESLSPPPLTPLAAVNVVGTGGGPGTFNISTAAAILAASVGTPVVKSGSRAYTSMLGSTDLLERAGVPVAGSHDEVRASLARYGIAFPGSRFYPVELTRLARRILPLGMKTFGRFLNTVGPFLASTGATKQLTGLSARLSVESAAVVADRSGGTEITLCTSRAGIDELCSLSTGLIRWPGGRVEVIEPRTLVAGRGSMSDLAPVDRAFAVEHLAGILAGEGRPAAVDTVLLNAAALQRVMDPALRWPEAIDRAREAARSGDAAELLAQLTASDRWAKVGT